MKKTIKDSISCFVMMRIDGKRLFFDCDDEECPTKQEVEDLVKSKIWHYFETSEESRHFWEIANNET